MAFALPAALAVAVLLTQPAQAESPLWLNTLTGDEYLQKSDSKPIEKPSEKVEMKKTPKKKSLAKKSAKKKNRVAKNNSKKSKNPRQIEGATFTKLQPATKSANVKEQKPIAVATATPPPAAVTTSTKISSAKKSNRSFLGRVSVLAGGQVSQVWDSQQEALSQTNHYGFGGGLLADIIGNDVSLETGVLYKMMGGSALAYFNGVPGRIDFDLDYLQFPLALKYYFSGPKRTTLFAKVGASYSQLVRKHAEATINEQAIATDEISGIAQGEFGALLGLGASIKMSDRTYLLIEASGYRALSKLSASESTVDLYNQSLNLTSGLAIEL